MRNSNEKIKNTFDRVIGKEPLLNEGDRERFQKWLKSEKQPRVKKHWIPRMATIILFGVAIFFAFTTLPINNLFDHAGQDRPSKEELLKPAEQDNRIPLEEVREKIDEIIATFRVDMTMEEVQDIFGEGYYYSGDSETDSRTFEALEYVYFTNVKKEDPRHPFMEGVAPYKNGDLGLNFNIVWYSDGTTIAFIHYLKGEDLETVQFMADGKVYDGDQFIGNQLYQVDASGFIVKSFADALGKDPREITTEDLQHITDLIVQPHSESAEVFDFDLKLLPELENLRHLHIKNLYLRYDEISQLTHLETLTLEGVEVDDIEHFKNLKQLRQLNITNTDTSTVAGIVDHPSLEVVILDKDKVYDWEKLEEAGIQVIDGNEK